MIANAEEAPGYITSGFAVVAFAAVIIVVALIAWLYREWEDDIGDRNKPVSQKTMRKYQDDQEHP